jgi:D-glycero-alpha-D-manno-heptose-7-phosphate kinase
VFEGELLDKNWKLKCQMAAEITDPQIDEWYHKGISAGAKGGKLLGAGNGGFMMFFAQVEKHPDIIKAMDGLREIPFSFDTNGSQIVYYQPNTSQLNK